MDNLVKAGDLKPYDVDAGDLERVRLASLALDRDVSGTGRKFTEDSKIEADRIAALRAAAGSHSPQAAESDDAALRFKASASSSRRSQTLASILSAKPSGAAPRVVSKDELDVAFGKLGGFNGVTRNEPQEGIVVEEDELAALG